MIRRKSRELCLQILFQKEFVNNFDLQNSLDYFRSHHQTHTDVLDYAKYLADGVLSKAAEIDSLINQNTNNWTTTRMSSVDLNILRMSVFEAILASEPNAPRIVINEALEIAKKYSTSESASFINGILDQLAKIHSLDLEA